MNQDYNESGGLLGGKGFYIALMLCVSVIAVSAWMIVSGNRDREVEQISVTATPALQYEVVGREDAVQSTPVMIHEIPKVEDIFAPEPSQAPVEEAAAPVEQPAVQTVSALPKSYV